MSILPLLNKFHVSPKPAGIILISFSASVVSLWSIFTCIVHYKLDYCNSHYYSLPESQIAGVCVLQWKFLATSVCWRSWSRVRRAAETAVSAGVWRMRMTWSFGCGTEWSWAQLEYCLFFCLFILLFCCTDNIHIKSSLTWFMVFFVNKCVGIMYKVGLCVYVCVHDVIIDVICEIKTILNHSIVHHNYFVRCLLSKLLPCILPSDTVRLASARTCGV